ASTQEVVATKVPLRRRVPKTRESPIALADSPPPDDAASVDAAPVASAPAASPPAASPPRKIAQTALMDASQSMSIPAVVVERKRPSRRATLLVVFGALLAGAASAGAVIAALQYYDQRQREAGEGPAVDPPGAPVIREVEDEERPAPAVTPSVTPP